MQKRTVFCIVNWFTRTVVVYTCSQGRAANCVIFKDPRVMDLIAKLYLIKGKKGNL